MSNASFMAIDDLCLALFEDIGTIAMSNASFMAIDDLCLALFEDIGTIVKNATCCPPSNDGISNWNYTRSNTVATQKCPSKILNATYDDKENITRECLANGMWAKRSNYDRCIFLNKVEYHMIAIWCIGYSISTIALFIALFLLRYFRTLRCLRNDIHCNLIASYIIRVFTWYIIVIPQITTSNWPIMIMNITTVFALFSQASNYFWMFVEGLYLFAIIVWTYGMDKINILHYSLIGWGVPCVLSGIATAAISIKLKFYDSNWFYNKSTSSIKLYCIHIPILAIIIINVFILGFVIFNVFIKLKQTKVPVPRRSSKLSLLSIEVKKAIKAAAVLIPLFGLAHCLFMMESKTFRFQNAYKVFNAILTSTQGFFVALIYCFLNREVKFVIKAKYRSFRGYLPSASRTRNTLDDSVGPARRGYSAFRSHKPENDNNVFKCRSYRSQQPTNGNNLKPVVPVKETKIGNQQIEEKGKI